MQCIEDLRWTNHLCEMVPVQVGAQRRLHMRERQTDATVGQILM